MGDTPSFRYSFRQTNPRLFDVHYAGHMSEDLAHVREIEALVRAAARPVGLVYDVADFTSFHPSQVNAHGELFARLGKQVLGVAVLHPRPVVWFGAITVSLISKTPIKAFDDRTAALAWLSALEAKAK